MSDHVVIEYQEAVKSITRLMFFAADIQDLPEEVHTDIAVALDVADDAGDIPPYDFSKFDLKRILRRLESTKRHFLRLFNSELYDSAVMSDALYLTETAIKECEECVAVFREEGLI